MMPLPHQMRELIELAMKEKAPALYARLKASGELAAEIGRRAQEAEESYLEASSLDLSEPWMRNQGDPMEFLQKRTMQKKIAAEEAISQATEFSPDDAYGPDPDAVQVDWPEDAINPGELALLIAEDAARRKKGGDTQSPDAPPED